MNIVRTFCFPVVLLLFSATIPAATYAGQSISDDRLVNGARLCTRHLPQEEKNYGIPSHLLTAIAATESGRYHKKLDIALPWPWTVNAEGKGYYFDSKSEAMAAVKKFRREGIRSIDVGCMQVNLYHHADAFKDLGQAFDPRYNVAYAAKFLRQNYDKDRSWKEAAGAYHSRTEPLGKKYSGKVFKNWRKILQMVSRGGGQKKDYSQQYAYAKPSVAAAPATGSTRRVAQGQQQAALQPHQAPKMRVIQVSQNEKAPARKPVVVSRPAVSAEARRGNYNTSNRGVSVVRPTSVMSSSVAMNEANAEGYGEELRAMLAFAEKAEAGKATPEDMQKFVAQQAAVSARLDAQNKDLMAKKKALASATPSAVLTPQGGQFEPRPNYVNVGHVTTSKPQLSSRSVFVFQ